MTRQHAHELVFGKCKYYEGKDVAALLDALEALGLIKFEKAPSLDCRTIRINGIYYSDGCDVKIYKAIEALREAGYKVDKA